MNNTRDGSPPCDHNLGYKFHQKGGRGEAGGGKTDYGILLQLAYSFSRAAFIYGIMPIGLLRLFSLFHGPIGFPPTFTLSTYHNCYVQW
jgi:hypothetical protein